MYSSERWIDCSSDSVQLLDFVPEKFFVQSIDIESDVDLDKKELDHLIAIHGDEIVDIKDLENAIFYLKEKGIFQKIFLHISDGEKGKKIIFKLEKFITFQALRLHAFMVGKEQYRGCYLIDVGDNFDKKKHELSFEKVKNKFYQQGFFNAKINDAIHYDKYDKNVVVDLFLNRGSQFSIGEVDFDLQTSKDISDEDLYSVKKELKDLFSRKFFKLKYSKFILDRSIKKLKRFLNRRGFAQAHVTLEEDIDHRHKEVHLTFVISFERKKQFVFWGNHFFSQDDFLENILMYGKSSWHFPGAILEDEILNMYKQKGFWDATASVREEENRVFCLVSEGRRAAIKNVLFKDNVHLSSVQLQECFKPFLKTRFFDRDLFEQGLSKLKNLYASHGYWDVKVVHESFMPLGEKSRYNCVLTLDEGSLTQLKSIEIQGHSHLLKIGPFAEFQKQQMPIPFDRNLIYQQRAWLTSYFHSIGHNKVFVEYDLVEGNGGVKLVWKVSLHEKQIHFGKTIVEGNSKIAFKYLKRELSYKEGDVWDKKKLEESIQRFKDLGIFEEVYVYPHKNVDGYGYNPIGIKLIEADKYELRTRIGLQQVGRDLSFYEGVSYKFGSTFVVNNPLKFGDRFIVDADFTRFYGNLSVQYLMPWIFTRPIRSMVKVYNNSYRHPLYVGSNISLYSALQQGVLFGVQEKKKNIDYGVNFGLDFSRIKTVDIDNIATSLDYNPDLFDKKVPYLFAEPSVLWTKLDSVMNPKKGFKFYASCKMMIDVEDKRSFVKVLGEHTFYTPFVKRSVIAVRMRVGHVFNRDFHDLSPMDRFYLGGANTVRGYHRDYCPPFGELDDPVSVDRAGLPDEAKGLWKYVPQGGRTMINSNIELRFPVYQDVEGVLFTDIGGLIKDSIHEDQSSIVGGSGIGIRYNTPIGPLRFDIAWKWQREYKDLQSLCVWYLTLGHAF